MSRRAGVGFVRIFDTECQSTSARAMLGGKVSRQTLGLAIDNEIDVALAVQNHIFRAVFGHQRKAHFFEQGL